MMEKRDEDRAVRLANLVLHGATDGEKRAAAWALARIVLKDYEKKYPGPLCPRCQCHRVVELYCSFCEVDWKGTAHEERLRQH